MNQDNHLHALAGHPHPPLARSFHNATRPIPTTGIVSDGQHLVCAATSQYGYDGWVSLKTVSVSFCGGDYAGRVSLPAGWPSMAIGHEAIVEARESIEWNGDAITAGHLYVPMPGRRRCVQFPDQACPLGAAACGDYVNRGTSRWPGYATVDNLEDPRFLIPIPDDLAEQGFIIEQLAICKHALRAALELRLLPQQRVAILGLGILGQLTAAELVDMGTEVVGYDVYASGPRREAFAMLGPRATFLQNAPASLKTHANSFSLVLELAGGPHSLTDAIELVTMGGTILAVGIPMTEEGAAAHHRLVVKGATVKGIVSADRIDFLQAVNSLLLWLHTRSEFVGQLVTHRLPYRDFEKALRIDPRERIKVALAFA